MNIQNKDADRAQSGRFGNSQLLQVMSPTLPLCLEAVLSLAAALGFREQLLGLCGWLLQKVLLG